MKAPQRLKPHLDAHFIAGLKALRHPTANICCSGPNSALYRSAASDYGTFSRGQFIRRRFCRDILRDNPCCRGDCP